MRSGTPRITTHQHIGPPPAFAVLPPSPSSLIDLLGRFTLTAPRARRRVAPSTTTHPTPLPSRTSCMTLGLGPESLRTATSVALFPSSPLSPPSFSAKLCVLDSPSADPGHLVASPSLTKSRSRLRAERPSSAAMASLTALLASSAVRLRPSSLSLHLLSSLTHSPSLQTFP